jgi:hypothetical protein
MKRSDLVHIAPKHWESISTEMANAVLRVSRAVHEDRSDLETWITSEAVPSQGEWVGEHPTLEDIIDGLPEVQDLPLVFRCKGRYGFLATLWDLFSVRVSEPVSGGPVETIIEAGCGWSSLVGMVDSEGFCEVRGNIDRADSYWRRAWAAIGLPVPMGPVVEHGQGECLRWFDRGYGHMVGPIQLSLLLGWQSERQSVCGVPVSR